ncbi:ABC transporter ATP-binding protein [Myceligenerans xiligouense]|uniref:ABC-2 type transport system ATP-binding protein n=1 Tax=Myceligenerans xiligouense TaxID=253184 RepID=A0A3N4Z0U9_9MICO|nr:ABC transporter ATP-binding protein [Myceligenerans xiligouense]RPF19708.1 ABC-2 type transport system ATP-binding protein [Myceligenerans xiligouense]
MTVTRSAPRSVPESVAGSPVVDVRNLRKTYPVKGGPEKVAVADVSFQVRRGEIFGILGPNGAGKTTAVECLAGLRRADGGTVRLLGRDPQADPASVREDVGIQLQEAALHDRITVGEALDVFASFYERRADPAELMDLLDLTEHRNVQFGKLSGGQKQRLSIALALVGEPQVAILDELTTGLDPAARRATWELVERVRDSGVTILLVTHFMDEAERLCDRLVVIDRGVVVAQGTPTELTDGLGRDRAVRLRFADDAGRGRALDLLTALATRDDDVTGVAPAGDEIEVTGTRKVLFAVVRELAAADVVPDDVRTVTQTLEDVFVHVTGREYRADETEKEHAA